MKPAVVVDVGNTFIKWGRCADHAVTEKVQLPPDDREAWQRQREAWRIPGPAAWAVAGVHPARRDAIVEWLRANGGAVLLIDSPAILPLAIQVERPDRVGMDRLLDAVAANRLRRPGGGAVVIDAGSAVTVDWVDPSGAFCGGAIFPGLRLMARALHDHTALLPLIDVNAPVPLPGRSTTAAMTGGIFWAVAGGIRAVVNRLTENSQDADVFFTGGDAERLAGALGDAFSGRLRVVPFLTLEGIRLTAEAQP